MGERVVVSSPDITVKANGEFEVARVELRFAASLVDVFAFAVASILAVLLLKISHGEMAVLGVIGSIGIIGFLLVYQTLLLSEKGQTIGKRMLGLRIVNAVDEQNPGFVKAVLLRQWFPGLLSANPYLGWVFWLADCL